MPPRFISADSYGGWESANQGYDQQRDARYFNSLAVADRRRQMAAQEAQQQAARRQMAAQEAQQQAAFEDAREAREMNWFLNREQMAQRAAEFGAGSGQWERDFGLRSRIADESVAERAARVAETLADREAQRTYSYDALRSGERVSGAQLDVQKEQLGVQKEHYRTLREAAVDRDQAQKEHYRTLREAAVDRDQAQTLKGAMDVTRQGVRWASPEEVMARYPDLSRTQAQVVFDLSQAAPNAMADDFLVAQALSKATRQKAQLPEMIRSTKEAMPWNLGVLSNPVVTMNRFLPGESVKSKLGQQLRDFAAEDTDLQSKIDNLTLRLEYPQPPRMNPAANALPVPRTIIPVSTGQTNASVSVPISRSSGNGFVVGQVYSGRGGPRVYLGGPITSPSSWGTP